LRAPLEAGLRIYFNKGMVLSKAFRLKAGQCSDQAPDGVFKWLLIERSNEL